MALIQSRQGWQFRTESDLEEVVWRNLPRLLKLKPLKRQFSIRNSVCDIVATEPSKRLVIVELKNVEDRYVTQQLVRYYDALSTAKALLFDVDVATPPRLIAIAPSFHADTLIDCKYSQLQIELLTFKIESSKQSQLRLVLSDLAGQNISTLPLPKALQTTPSDHVIPEPPRKLLNWLSPMRETERDWILALRKQLLGADARMRERVEPNRIFYEKNKSKPCCELRKIKPSEYRGEGIDCYLWLPDPENNPHVIKMWVGFNLKSQKVDVMHYGKKGYRSGSPWYFPDCIKQMKGSGYQRALKQYQPFLRANMTISPVNLVNLALQTWHSRL